MTSTTGKPTWWAVTSRMTEAIAIRQITEARSACSREGQACAQGVQRQLGAVRQVQRGEDVADVAAHGPLAEVQSLGNLTVGEPLSHQAHHLPLPVRERLERRWRVYGDPIVAPI